MNTEVLLGAAASDLLTRTAFKEDWEALERRCPWTTVYQTWDFVSRWYATYPAQYQPCLVLQRDAAGRLAGLLPLATPSDGGAPIVAGSYHAEYQAWLATPETGEQFIQDALAALQQAGFGSALLFTYLPPGTPIAWLAPGQPWAAQAEHLRLPRPLAAMGDGASFKASLKKKGNKSKISRLERIGKLRMEEITDPERLAALFDEIERYGTFRIGALRSVSVLAGDPDKKAFYLRLMRETSLLHVTVLWAGEQMLSAHIGVRDGQNVVLTIFTHAPFHARHSPGKLHLLYLGVLLAEQGVANLDLTPTGEYKDRFASHHDEVGRLQVFLSRGAQRRYELARRGREAVKSLLRARGRSPEEARTAMRGVMSRLARVRPADVPRMVWRRVAPAVHYQRELRIYSYDATAAQALAAPAVMRRDHVPDILAYRPQLASEATVQEFLRHCLERLEEGQHCYTRVEDGVLAHYGWLIDRQERSYMVEVGQVLLLPPDSAVLYNFYTRQSARGRGYYQAALRQMVGDAARIPGTKQIWISVLADNGASRHTIEKVGFTYRFSFFERRTLGRVSRWTTAPAEFVGAMAAPAEAPAATGAADE